MKTFNQVMRGKTTRFRIMLLSRGSAGIGRRARLRTACPRASGFESPLPHWPYLAPLCNQSLSNLVLNDYPLFSHPPLSLRYYIDVATAIYKLYATVPKPLFEEVVP